MFAVAARLARCFKISIVCLILFSAQAQTADEIKAEAIKAAAEAGHAFSQANLGVMYINGNGVPQDYKLAVKWYMKSAEQGHVQAQVNLGTIYYAGEGVRQNYKLAAKWYKKAAKQGHAQAQEMLRRMVEANPKLMGE